MKARLEFPKTLRLRRPKTAPAPHATWTPDGNLAAKAQHERAAARRTK
jgi:hypothetical protein